MAETLQMWDRLAGELIVYVENYLLSSKSGLGFGLDPSYKVDYEIKDTILDYLEKTLNSGDINEIWQHRITTCKNVNDLPNKLQKLVNQFLPRFLSQHPEYKHEKSLVGKRRTHTFEGHADEYCPLCTKQPSMRSKLSAYKPKTMQKSICGHGAAVQQYFAQGGRTRARGMHWNKYQTRHLPRTNNGRTEIKDFLSPRPV